MSYQTASDRVAALRNIRGGRLTKWKGIVVSCAPTMGVVALAISTLGVAGAANAANECTAGVAPAAGATVICTTANYNPADGDIIYSNVNGLTLELNDASLNVTSSTTAVSVTGATTSAAPVTISGASFGTITTTGESGYGLFAQTNGTGAANAVINDGTITTAGSNGHGLLAQNTNAANASAVTATMDGGSVETGGVRAYGLLSSTNGTGAATAVINDGTITTTGESGYGLFAQNDNAANASAVTATMDGGSVETGGISGYGLYALTSGTGAANAVINDGTITTAGYGSYGLFARNDNAANASAVTVTMDGGSINTAGTTAHGIYAVTVGTGAASALMNDGAITTTGGAGYGVHARASGTGTANALITGGAITTTGANATGVIAQITDSSSAATSTALMTSGTVATSGQNGHGVYSGTLGTGLATATVAGDAVVKAGGVDSDGIRALISQAAATYAVAVDGTASVTGGFGAGAGIRTASVADSSGTINIGADATVDGSRGTAGIVDDAGNTTMTIDGTLLGGISAGDGDDVANLNATSVITGDIAMGDGSDVVTIASGADVSGLTLLDGGDDLTAGDGFIDVLSVDGLSGAVDGSIITNWEEINVANSDVQVTDLVAGAVSVTDSTVVATNLTADEVTLANSTTTLDGTSVVATVNTCGGVTTLTGSTAATDVLGCASDDTIVIDGDAVVANAIEGAGGSDSVSVLGNASAAIINVAGDGSDASAATDNNNSVLVNTTGTVGTVIGGDQADAITLTAGTVGTVVAGGGADTIIANGADVTTSIDAGAGNDIVTWSAGTVAAIATGLGSDALTVSASEYDGSQVLNGGDDLTTADGMVDTLTFKNLTVAATGANVTNWENVVIDGGTVSFSDNALTTGSDAKTGLSIVNGGALDAGDAFALTGNLTVNAGSTFDGTGAGAGVYSISGDLINNGVVTTQDGVVGDTITVAGNYSGTGILSVDIDTATDTIDTLVIAGDVTGGPTTVVVNNLSPLGASGNALTVIAVGGTSAAGDFVLDGGSLTAGAFDYNLAHQGSNFVLASAVNSTGAVYQAAPSVLSGLNSLPTLEQRVGQRQWAGTNVARGELQPSTGGWLRLRGDKLKASNTTGVNADTSTWGLQAGIDYNVETGGEGQWVLGVTGQYGKLGSTITNPLGFGKIDAEGFGIGATATWYGTKGTYVDLQGQVNWISSDMSSSAAGSLAEGELSKAYALSAEVGHRFELDQNTTLVPQAQLTFGKIQGASFTDSAGNAVDLGSNTSMTGRLGLAYEYENNDRTDGNRTKAYVIGNILHDFSKDSMVNVAGANLSSANSGKTWGEIGLGGSVTMDTNKTIFGEASYRDAFNGGSNKGFGLTAGLRVQW